MVVDASHRELAARQLPAHPFQHDVGARSGAGSRRSDWSAPHGHHLRRFGYVRVSAEFLDGALADPDSALSRRAGDAWGVGVNPGSAWSAPPLRAEERKPPDPWASVNYVVI